MSDEMELLREFRSDVPAPSEETRRRIYAYATQTTPRRSWTPRIRGPRWQVALAAALAVAAAAIAAAATGGGASSPKGAQSIAQGVDGVVTQVQNGFGDGRILSASVEGSMLSVKLSAPTEPSQVSATFEAQVLAHAVRDWMTASGQAPIASVQYLDANGTPLQGSPEGGDPVGSDPNVASLSSDACHPAAQAMQAKQASLTSATFTIVSARTVPEVGGACVVEFQTSDPESFASNAPITISSLVNTMGDPNERPYLVQVDDQSGSPQFVASYVPGEGGQTYIKPGLNQAFVGGGVATKKP